MNFTNELINKAKLAKSIEELREIAKANNVELSQDEASFYFNQLNHYGELSDDELDSITGGSKDPENAKYSKGNSVSFEIIYKSRPARLNGTVIDVWWNGSQYRYKVEYYLQNVCSVGEFGESELSDI